MNEYAFNRTFNAMQEAYDNMQPPDDYYDEDEGRTLDWIYGK